MQPGSDAAAPLRGRGVSDNPRNRFVPLTVLPDPDATPHSEGDAHDPLPRTEFFRDESRSVIAHNTSPDVGFEYSLNPYRGCEHGCIYCYARPTHEYLGFSAGLDFETKITVKEDAPDLLREEMSSAKWRPKVISIGGVTDPYQPVERRLALTRRCIEAFAAFRNPLTIITKNHLVTRDIDLLAEMSRERLAGVFISITTLEPALTRIMEPRTSAPRMRLEALRELSRNGVPVGVMVAPVIPGLTDHEMPRILEAAAEAGARTAGYVPLRLPFAVKDLFERWLEQHMPDRKDKVLNRIRSLRGGKLNDSNFMSRMRGEGIFAEQIRTMFDLGMKRAGIPNDFPHLRTDLFRRPESRGQMSLW